MTETTAWYIDYPGAETIDTRPIAERTVTSLDAAIAEAISVYRDRPDVPLVVVCSFPNLLRVVTVSGDRRDPHVTHRRGT